MGLIFRKSIRLGKGTRLNLSKSGVSASKRFGRLTLSSRGRGALRLGKGWTWRF